MAGHAFEFIHGEDFPCGGRLLAPYLPFADDGSDECIFRLRIVRAPLPPTGRLIRRCNDEAPYLWIYEDISAAEEKCFGHSLSPDEPMSILRCDGDEALLTIAPACGNSAAAMAVNNSAMLLYTWKTGGKATLLLHASATVRRGRAYLFLGRSGTGKSTHSRMWMEPCWKNERAVLGGIVRIVRAPHNKAVRLSSLESFASLVSSCSSIIWDRKWKNEQEDCVEKVVSLCPGWNMECLPDAEAAEVCSKAVEGI